MKLLKEFTKGDGSHWGLSDWYKEAEKELVETISAQEPFDTDWYSSKKEIASARIWSTDGKTINVAVSVTDDFDTIGKAERVTDWSIEKIRWALEDAWQEAERDREANEEYVGFKLVKHSNESSSWIETYLVNIGWGESLSPSGDYYHWWGWQHDENEKGEGIPYPKIPIDAVPLFEKWALAWTWGQAKEKSLRIGDWEMIPFRDKQPDKPEDPSDYVGMGWIGADGRP